MRTYKPMCPYCGGTNTIIRSSVRHSPMLQTLYCDCLNDECYTRFAVQSETIRVLSTLKSKKAATLPDQIDQLPLNLA